MQEIHFRFILKLKIDEFLFIKKIKKKVRILKIFIIFVL